MIRGILKIRETVRQRFGKRRPQSILRSVRSEKLTYLDEAALNDLYDEVSKLERRGAKGILIEAGCALGGSAIVMAAAKARSRPFFVYDVFGMIPPPSDADGTNVHDRYQRIVSGRSAGIEGNKYYGYEQDLLEKVAYNFRRLSVPAESNSTHFIKGLFEETLRVENPVALAHLDGDWYRSTMTCLQRIEPHLILGGVLIIDDYYHWSGCRKAVDEYFERKRSSYEFVRKSRLHIVRKQ